MMAFIAVRCCLTVFSWFCESNSAVIYTLIYISAWHIFTLTFPPLSEEACSVLLPVLHTVVMWRGKKSVVCVAQGVAALILVHQTSSLFWDIYRLLDPPGAPVGFPVQDCWYQPVDHMVLMTSIRPGSVVVFSPSVGFDRFWHQ